MELTGDPIYICADATPVMGTGHVMRCLALAQTALSRNRRIHILSRLSVPWVLARLQGEGIPHTLLPDTPPPHEAPQVLLRHLYAAGAERGVWVVLDGYHFGLDCQEAVRAAGYKLLVIDDYAHLPEYSCDILLNQNLGAEELPYKGDIGLKRLGPEYVLLRTEFLAVASKAGQRCFSEKAQNILITLGGGDFFGHLAQLAPKFTVPELQGCTVRVIAGAMHPERVRSLLQDCPAYVEILNCVKDMPALLLDTDLCVTAGGSTCWELCFLGVPFLTVEVARNQHNFIELMQKFDYAPKLNSATLQLLRNNAFERRAMSQKIMKLVDGLGCTRVLSICFS